MPTSAAVPTSDEIWKILGETSAIGKETDKRLDKTSREIEEFRISQEESSRKANREIAAIRAIQEESSRKASREMEEIRAIQRETMEEMKETDRLMKETDRRMKETDKQIKKTEALFNTQWGQLMESLVEGDLIEILNQWGIAIAHTSTRVKQRGQGDDYEYDIIAVNGREVVVVEVKTTLKVSDVKDFLESLGKLTVRMPYHKDKRIYGAVAWLRADEEAEVYAAKQGLFVIRATGSSARIVNREDFKPQVFS